MNNLKSFSVFSSLTENNDIGSDIDDLISGFQNLGINMTDEEIQMEKFVELFGGGKNPDEWAEYLFDYYHNPEEYFIEKDSEYYEQICEFYLNSVQPHEVRRYYENFDYNSTAKTPEYKLYLKMSSKNR